MKAMIILAAALSLSACATASLDARPIRTDGLARLNEATRVGAFVVTPRAVIEDSRCPINARCIWAGRLRLQADISINGGSEELRSILTLGEPGEVPGGRLMLVSAEPGKMAGSPPSPPASLFGFEAR